MDISIEDIREFSKTIRLSTLEMISKGNSSHIGSVFSIADILGVLYGGFMRIKPKDPDWKGRDRFVLSKGHAGAGVYASLAERGFFSKDLLKEHYKNGSVLSGHISHKNVPGVELSTGSLGHGLGVSAGMAYAAKLDKKKHRIICLLSDGECDEGSIWEAVLFSSHHKLDNLIVIVDYNKFQSLKSIQETLSLEPFKEKWQAFGWEVNEADGHDHSDILQKLNSKKQKPFCLIAHTIKGKGVSFMENKILWHYRSPQGKEYKAAKEELENA